MAVEVWEKGIPEGRQVDRAKGSLVTPPPRDSWWLTRDDVRLHLSTAAGGTAVQLRWASPGTWRPSRVCMYLQSDAETLQLDGLGVGAGAADSPGHLA